MSEERIPSLEDFKFAVTTFDPAGCSYGSFNANRDETFSCQNLRDLKVKLENISTGSECGSLFVLHQEKSYNAVVFTSLDTNPTECPFLGINPQFPEDEELYAPMQYDSLAPFLFEALGQSLEKITTENLKDRWKNHMEHLAKDPSHAVKDFLVGIEEESVLQEALNELGFSDESMGDCYSWTNYLESSDGSSLLNKFHRVLQTLSKQLMEELN
jgi:hypothetical protein